MAESDIIQSKNKRKQKLETKTKSLNDEVEFDVELSESSDEIVTDLSGSDENDEMIEYKVTLQELPPRRPKRKSSDLKNRKMKDVKIKKVKGVKVEKQEEYFVPVKKNVISKIDEPAYNLYRKVYNEMDLEEVNYAWEALSSRERSLWRKKAFEMQELKTVKQVKFSNEATDPNDVNCDLDLPAIFPDAANEVRKLLERCIEEISNINIFQIVLGSSLPDNAKNFTSLIELQKYIFNKTHSNDTIGVNSAKIIKRYIMIRNKYFQSRLRSIAMRPSLNCDNLVKRDGYCENDFVYVQQSYEGADVNIVRIKEKYLGGKVVLGCQFVRPNSFELEHISPIYRNNLIMVNDGTKFEFKSEHILGKCIVLNFSDYITARPTDIPEEDVYYCTHMKTCKRLIRPPIIEDLTNVLENYPGEIYFFAFNGKEDLIHNNQFLWVPEVKQESMNEDEIIENFGVKTEMDYLEPVVKCEIPPEIQIKEEEYEDDYEVITPDEPESSQYCNTFPEVEPAAVAEPGEIILYDDTTNTINLADTEDVLFIVDNLDSYDNSPL